MKIKRKVFIELPIEEFQRLEVDLKADERFQFSVLHNDGINHLAFALKSDWSSVLVITPKTSPDTRQLERDVVEAARDIETYRIRQMKDFNIGVFMNLKRALEALDSAKGLKP